MAAPGLFRLRRCGLLLLFAVVATAQERDEQKEKKEQPVHVIETGHYRLHAEGPRDEAEEMGRILEAAYKGFKEYFGTEPKLAEGAKLEVRYYLERERFREIVGRFGSLPEHAGGVYIPPVQTAFLFRQPAQYFTRHALIHEACHQFHFLARTNNNDSLTKWYTEGIAEYVSTHQWDGETLTLRALPRIWMENHAGRSLKEVNKPGFDLGNIVDQRAEASYPLSWAFIRFLATSNEGKPRDGFEAFARRLERRGDGPHFQQAFGKMPDVQERFIGWLRQAQATWQVMSGEWEDIGPGRFRGIAHGRGPAMCRVRRPVTELSATMEIPEGDAAWAGGLLLHNTFGRDFTIAMVSSAGRMVVRGRGKWGGRRTLLSKRMSFEGQTRVHLRAVREGENVTLTIDDATFGPWTLPGTAFGLVVRMGDVRFGEIAAK